MRHAIANLLRHRVLIQSLVARELKARYRGSVLGYLWSLLNPLLLLLVYTIVFSTIFEPPGSRADTQPYALFLFCGLLPWTWFSSALSDAANSLLVGGNLIKKLIFPAEVLPIVAVLANGVHFLLGLPIYLAFWVIFKGTVSLHLLWLPLVMAVQLIFTLGLGLFLAPLAVHFRDVRDILANALTLWFFATPIIYARSIFEGRAAWLRWAIDLNPMTHIIDGYHTSIFEGTLIPWKRLPVTLAVSLVLLLAGYAFFDRLRDSFPEEV
ncbi:MAG: ABC transporter permease [Acidobacteriota bacterium]